MVQCKYWSLPSLNGCKRRTQFSIKAILGNFRSPLLVNKYPGGEDSSFVLTELHHASSTPYIFLVVSLKHLYFLQPSHHNESLPLFIFIAPQLLLFGPILLFLHPCLVFQTQPGISHPWLILSSWPLWWRWWHHHQHLLSPSQQNQHRFK